MLCFYFHLVENMFCFLENASFTLVLCKSVLFDLNLSCYLLAVLLLLISSLILLLCEHIVILYDFYVFKFVVVCPGMCCDLVNVSYVLENNVYSAVV